jgi:hypothetical protein
MLTSLSYLTKTRGIPGRSSHKKLWLITRLKEINSEKRYEEGRKFPTIFE